MLFDEVRVHNRRSLFILLAAVIVVFLLWNVSELSGLLYPFRLFVTLIHEAAHGLTAILTGGRFVSFEVDASGAGLARTVNGIRALILPAGYLGAALFGAVLFYLVNRVGSSRSIAFVLGALIILISLFFGLSSLTALLVGGLFGVLLLVMGWKANRDINRLVLNVLAMMTGLNAVLDVYWLVGSSTVTMGSLRNDAYAFSSEVAPLVPPAIWALIWVVLAVTMLGVSVYYSLIRPLRQG